MSNPDNPIFSNKSRFYTINALRLATQSILGKFSPVGISKVVELGCGDGFFYREILPEHLKPLYKGYDNHRPSLEQFRQLNPEVQTELADANNLDLADSSVDMVVGFSAFPLFNMPQVVAEILRITRPGGRVFMFQDNAIVDPKGKNDAYDKMQRVETYHRALESKFTRSGWVYKAGVDVAEAVVKTSYKDAYMHIPQELLDKNPNEPLLVAVTRDIGISQVYQGKIDTAELEFNKAKEHLGNPTLLADINFNPGQEVPEYLRMRYLVAEKRSW